MVREVVAFALGKSGGPGSSSSRTQGTPRRPSSMGRIRPAGPPPTITTRVTEVYEGDAGSGPAGSPVVLQPAVAARARPPSGDDADEPSYPGFPDQGEMDKMETLPLKSVKLIVWYVKLTTSLRGTVPLGLPERLKSEMTAFWSWIVWNSTSTPVTSGRNRRISTVSVSEVRSALRSLTVALSGFFTIWKGLIWSVPVTFPVRGSTGSRASAPIATRLMAPDAIFDVTSPWIKPCLAPLIKAKPLNAHAAG